MLWLTHIANMVSFAKLLHMVRSVVDMFFQLDPTDMVRLESSAGSVATMSSGISVCS